MFVGLVEMCVVLVTQDILTPESEIIAAIGYAMIAQLELGEGRLQAAESAVRAATQLQPDWKPVAFG